ncbi:MAG: Hsp20/alpha crystallin family protein [Saprospiraceae bacterium]|nr:Hsp20/alpha crystallin family protein [Saprospiraceae bacterium]
MTLVKFNPFAPIGTPRFHSNFDRLLSDVFNAPIFNDDVKNMPPSVNVVETTDYFRLDIAAPGLAKEDFKINVEDNTLTISAEKKSETKAEGTNLRREFTYSSFKRSFTLPETTVATNIKGTYEAGILTLTLPKTEPQKTVQTIHIQ